ncbi:MAG: hypothetical protein RIK87_25455 [Fuerstiella sp.]
MKCIAAVLAGCLSFACLMPAAISCPLCLAPSQTWSEMIAEADVVLLATLVSRDPGAEFRRPSAVFRVAEVHKGLSRLSVGATVQVDEFVSGEAGEFFLLKGAVQDLEVSTFLETFASTEPGNVSSAAANIRKVAATSRDQVFSEGNAAPVLVWDAPEPATPTTFRYLTEAPLLSVAPTERLKYFLSFLEHPDALIAGDAWGEFAKSEYTDIKEISHLFSRRQLRDWIAASQTSPERLNLYGLMLGMCGTTEDEAFLRDQIGLPQADGLRFGSEGLMGGLLTLAGENGLQFIEQTRLKNADVPVFEAYAAVQALQFIWNHEPAAFEKQRLRNAMHPMLQREELREIAIRDLARWEDWTLVEDLPPVYQACRADDSRTTRAIVGYLLLYLKTAEQHATEPEQVTAAEQLLQQIRRDDVRLVKAVERELQ